MRRVSNRKERSWLSRNRECVRSEGEGEVEEKTLGVPKAAGSRIWEQQQPACSRASARLALTLLPRSRPLPEICMIRTSVERASFSDNAT